VSRGPLCRSTARSVERMSPLTRANGSTRDFYQASLHRIVIAVYTAFVHHVLGGPKLHHAYLLRRPKSSSPASSTAHFDWARTSFMKMFAELGEYLDPPIEAHSMIVIDEGAANGQHTSSLASQRQPRSDST